MITLDKQLIDLEYDLVDTESEETEYLEELYEEWIIK